MISNVADAMEVISDLDATISKQNKELRDKDALIVELQTEVDNFFSGLVEIN